MPARGKIYVKDLKVGDVVDLEWDEHADQGHDVVDYVYEYQVVESISVPFGWARHVTFENGDYIAFPPLHEILTVPADGFGGMQ